jgi:hypothetical protein
VGSPELVLPPPGDGEGDDDDMAIEEVLLLP